MALRDLKAFLEDDKLVLQGVVSDKFPDGKTYSVDSPSAATGLWLQTLLQVGAKARVGAPMTDTEREQLHLDDEQEETLYKRVLAATYDEMIADGVSWTRLQKIGQYAFTYYAMNEASADVMLGEAPARPNRATRRTAKKKAGTKSSRASTVSASQTPQPGSTGSSTSPSEPEAQAKAV